MPKKSETHSYVVLRPPPGTRFTIWGSDVHLEFQTSKAREIITWLRNWITQYIEPEAVMVERNISIAQAQQAVVMPVQTASVDSHICICGTTNNVHSDECDIYRADMRRQPTQAPVPPTQPQVAQPAKPLKSILKEIADREFAKLTELSKQNQQPSNNSVLEESDNHGKVE